MARWLLASAMLAIGLTTGCTSFTAGLGGKEMVPATGSVIPGSARLTWNKYGGTFYHEVEVGGLKDLTGATLHMLPPKKCGKKKPLVGPVVIKLPVQPREGVYAGVISSGTFGPDALVGPLAGRGVSALVTALRQGRVYIVVTTKEHPDGELRGTFHGSY